MGKALEKPADTLYERDFYAWTQEQGAKLRARAHNEIDWDNTAEEIESLGKSDRHEIKSRLKVLFTHLLKWEFQPDQRIPSRSATIREQRQRLADRLDESPSLRPYPAEVADKEYAASRYDAADETGLPLDTFPTERPYTIERCLDRRYFPGTDQPDWLNIG